MAGRGEAEHADPANLYPMEDIGQIALLAKHLTDSLFAEFAEGPQMLPDVDGRRGQIHDLWAERHGLFEGMTFPEQQDHARYELRSYLTRQGAAGSDVPSVLAQFRADPDFETPNPAAGIVNAVIDKLVGEPELVQRVLEIRAGVQGEADPETGNVWVQRLRAATDEDNQRALWTLLRVLIHEGLHLRMHPAFRDYYESLPALARDVLQEGLVDLLVRLELRAHRRQFDDPKVRDRVLGDYAAAPPLRQRPHPSEWEYRSVAEARQVVHMLGGDIRNLLAAAFLGEMDRIIGPGNGAARALPRRLPSAREVAALAVRLNALPVREPTVVPVGPFVDKDATEQEIEELLAEPAADEE